MRLPVALCCLIVRGLDLELVSKRLIYLRIDEQETYLSADKNTRVVLESYHLWKGIPAIISGGVDIHEASGFHLLQKICFQGR